MSGSKQIKVVMPPHLYAALRQEAKDAAVTMADLVRLAVLNRYRGQAISAGLPSEVVGRQMPEDGASQQISG